MNDFFANTTLNLDIRGYEINTSAESTHNRISNIITKFKDHPSIQTIKEKLQVNVKFSFSHVNTKVIMDEINFLDTSKPTTFNNIPAKILACSNDICSLGDIFNSSVTRSIFPTSQKMADISPADKKDEKNNKENYRPISILH